MGQGIWGSISHPSGMLWRPFRGRFLQILQPKGVFRSLFLCISCIYETSKPLPVAKGWQLQWEGVLTFRTLIVKAMGRCFQLGIYASYLNSNFLVNFSSFGTCGTPKNTDTYTFFCKQPFYKQLGSISGKIKQSLSNYAEAEISWKF